jgi:hypothetical protein
MTRRLGAPHRSKGGTEQMILLGIILLVISFVVGIHLLWVLGALLLVVGVVLALAGATGRAIGGRPHYF